MRQFYENVDFVVIQTSLSDFRGISVLEDYCNKELLLLNQLLFEGMANRQNATGYGSIGSIPTYVIGSRNIMTSSSVSEQELEDFCEKKSWICEFVNNSSDTDE